MHHKSTVYIDVTQLVHWSGRLTGIPRVIDELAIRFAQDPEVRFIVWVKDLGTMCEIDLGNTLAQRGQGIVYLREGAAARQAEVAVGRPLIPESDQKKYRQQVMRFAKRIVKRVLRASPVLFGKLETRLKQRQLHDLKKAHFKRGDILFIPWGEWWDQAFTECLLRYQKSGIQLVQVIHDIAPTVWPQFFEQVAISPTVYNSHILPVASLVLAVSENTKRELAAWLKQNNLHIPPIKVIRNGDDMKATVPTKPHEQAFVGAKLSGKDYLLCVGTIEAKKNHTLFYYTYKLAKTRRIGLPKLVIVGRRGYRTGDIYEIMTHDPEVSDRFIFLHNVSDEELAWLYDHCLFTVLPSFHEGWGIPVAESLARGVPCLCSNTSSMIEIAENIVGHFSPSSSDECLAAIQRWLDPQELQDVRKRTKLYKPTTWDDTFRQVQQYIEEI
jgi:glycosyltransferase involved in cell wall biosynthesis